MMSINEKGKGLVNSHGPFIFVPYKFTSNDLIQIAKNIN